ncbi:sigma-54-dependent Fis family transcriptional regulator [bacterium]|nr:MAG: sigma-54-dependent Fis family transcriptional regulator [bacterium]
MSKPLGKILVMDDNEDILLAARLFLKQHATLVHAEKDPNLLPALLKNESYDIILLDMNYTRDVSSGQEGFYWLDRILQAEPAAVVVLITAYGDVEMAVRAIKAGAVDFIMKPWQNEKLLATLSAAMRLRQSRAEVEQLRSQQQQLNADLDQQFHGFIGTSPAMQEVFAVIRKVAATDANVLILGENGTGKELVARELHRQSHRSRGVFMSVDMGAIPETLFESELFGHVKGAFTDAREDRAGRFEIASGGTLFLDEIGNLSFSSQAKLLSAVDSRQVTRVGSSRPRPIDIRLICATNKPIKELAERKEFREDLLYRINTVEISLPPLRERITDIPLLAQHYLHIYARKYQRTGLKIAGATMAKLERYSWPGNVRELLHAVERAVIMAAESALQPSDFLLSSQQLPAGDGVVLDNYNLETVEKSVIRKAMAKHNGNVTQAAKELGLTRTALYRRLEKHGL